MNHKGINNSSMSVVSSMLLLDMTSISSKNNRRGISQSEMDETGLTVDAVEDLFNAKFSKVGHKVGNNRMIYEYSAYESVAYQILYFRLGDGYDLLDVYTLTKNKSTSTWDVMVNSI